MMFRKMSTRKLSLLNRHSKIDRYTDVRVQLTIGLLSRAELNSAARYYSFWIACKKYYHRSLVLSLTFFLNAF